MTERPRLIHWLMGLIVVLAFGFAGAASASTTHWVTYGSAAPLYPSADAYCTQAVKPQTFGTTSYPNGPDQVTCWYKVLNQNTQMWDYYFGGVGYKLVLPDCPAPQVRNSSTGQCAPPPPPDCAKSLEIETKDLFVGIDGQPAIWPKCDGQCAISVVSFVGRCHSFPGSAHPEYDYCTFEITRPGGMCAAPSTEGNVGAGVGQATEPSGPISAPLNEDMDNCPAGSVQGGIDSSGTPVCIGTGTAKPPPKAPAPQTTSSNTTANADGSTTTVDTNTQSNSDGSTTTTTKTTTTSADGTTSTETEINVTNTPAGSPGATDPNPDDEKYDMCAKHPDLAVCKNSTVSGACEQTACTGDAIQCATLREVAQLQCRDQKDREETAASGMFQAGQNALAGVGIDTPSITEIGIDAGLDKSGFLGGGACFGDKSITVQGHTIVLPFSVVCNLLLVLRYVTMIVAGLVSFRILSGSILQG